MHVGLLEDEEIWSRRIVRALEDAGWSAASMDDPDTFVEAIENDAFDLLIVDVHLDGRDRLGTDVLHGLRHKGRREPILLLTQFAERHRVADALDAGADDYLAKPFDPEELVARVRAMHRRADTGDPTVIECGPLTISRHFRSAHWYDDRIELRGQGFDILAVLAQAQGDVVSLDRLWSSVWTKWSRLPPQDQPIHAGISRLRKDIASVTSAKLVVTVTGRGYRIDPDC